MLILVSAKAEQEPSMPNTLTQFTLEVEESDSEILDKRGMAEFMFFNNSHIPLSCSGKFSQPKLKRDFCDRKKKGIINLY